MNFSQVLGFHARYRPDGPALFFPDTQDQPLSYAELDRLSDAVGTFLLGAGVPKGSVVALQFQNDLLHAVVLIGCARCGIATLSGDASVLTDTLPVAALLHDQRGLVAAPAGAARAIDIDLEGLRALPAGVDASRSATTGPDDLCRILATSGSTGSPKPVGLTYRMIASRVDACAVVFGSDFPGVANVMCGMRLGTSLGTLFLFRALAIGGLFCADSQNFDKIVAAISRFGIRALVTSPFTLAELVAYEHSHPSTWPRIGLVLTAGSLVSSELAGRIRARLCEKLVVFYGTTEVGVVASCWWAPKPGEVGFVVPGRRVEIVDPQGGPQPSGTPGRVRIRASDGPVPYFGAGNLVARNAHDYFEPGDIGTIDTHGALVIHGRDDGVVNIGGTKTTPELLEQSLLGAPGITDCGVVVQRDPLGIDRIIAFLVLGPFWNQQAFQAHCARNIIRDFLPNKFVVLRQIPRLPNRKIDRPALKKLAETS